MKSQVVARVDRKEVPKTIASLERWAKTLDVFYIRDFSVLFNPLDELEIDFSKAKKAWDAQDWQELCLRQIELMRDWETEFAAKEIRIPRCAVYFFSTMDRKRYGVRRAAFGDCDRHVTRLSIYELMMSCIYRQINQQNLFRDDNLVVDVMSLHRPWFQWMTDIQRIIVWTRRREYTNIAAHTSITLRDKIQNLSCSFCKNRYTNLINRMTRSYTTVLAYGKPFNRDNFHGAMDSATEKTVETLVRLKEQDHGGS